MVRAFHWQYGDILLAIYFFVFTYYFVLSLKNKYTILLYYTIHKFCYNLQALLFKIVKSFEHWIFSLTLYCTV